MRAAIVAGLIGFLGVSACAEPRVRVEPQPRASAAPKTAPAVPIAVKTLQADNFETLDLGGGEVAFAAIPKGAHEKRIVIVGVHGAGDRADWSCMEWQQVTADWAFVICPRGVVHPTYPGTFVWGSPEQIAARADRAVAAVRAKYGDFMDDGPMMIGAWSQGATLAAQVVAARPNQYDRVVMVEVGHTAIDPYATAHMFEANGVSRAIVSCSSQNCRTFAKKFAKASSIATRTVDVGDRGHWFDEPVFRALGPAVAWLEDDRPRYAGLAAAIDARWMTD